MQIVFDYIGMENLRMIGEPGTQGIHYEGPKRTTNPFVRWNVEANFFPLQDRLRQLVPHEFLQQDLLLRAPNLERRRQGGGKFDDTVVQERWAQLDGMGHAHAVRFDQDVVRQIILLVEPQVSA